ncbi:hypothetical protein NBRC116597_19960 [Phaeobacter sp. NW0010-22]
MQPVHYKIDDPTGQPSKWNQEKTKPQSKHEKHAPPPEQPHMRCRPKEQPRQNAR